MNAFCFHFSRFASYLNVSVISQGSAATYLRCGEIYQVIRVENFSSFTWWKNLVNRLRLTKRQKRSLSDRDDHVDVVASLSLSDPDCSSPSHIARPSALVLMTSDGGDAGHDACAMCCGALAGNTTEWLGPSSSAAVSSAVSVTSSVVCCCWQTVGDVVQSSSASLSSSSEAIFASVATITELPLHERSSATDWLGTSDTTAQTNKRGLYLHHLICMRSVTV